MDCDIIHHNESTEGWCCWGQWMYGWMDTYGRIDWMGCTVGYEAMPDMMLLLGRQGVRMGC